MGTIVHRIRSVRKLWCIPVLIYGHASVPEPQTVQHNPKIHISFEGWIHLGQIKCIHQLQPPDGKFSASKTGLTEMLTIPEPPQHNIIVLFRAFIGVLRLKSRHLEVELYSIFHVPQQHAGPLTPYL